MRQNSVLPLRLLLCASLALVIPCCASLGGPVAGTGEKMAYPSWVEAGTHVGRGGEAKALYGLGEVRGIRNVALARATADNRARAELAQLLDVFVGEWLEVCATQATAAQAAASAAGPQDKAALVRLLTASNLSAVQIVEHYFHPNDGAVFSLARLEVSHIEQHLQASSDVPAPIKSCLLEQSASTYSRLQKGTTR